MSFYRGEGGSGSGSVTSEPVGIGQGGTGATTAADARTNLGLGTIATQNANNVTVTGGVITGITDIAIADGGTGASTAAGARTNLGLATVAATGDYTDLSNKPSIPADLDDLSDVTLSSPSIGQVLKYDGSAWTNQADAVATGDVVGPNSSTDSAVALFDGTTGLLLKDSAKTLPSGTILGSDAIGVSVQAYDADTAKYDDVTANFSGTLQNGGSNVVVDSDIGSTVQAYDSNLTTFVGAFTLPTTDGTNGQALTTNGSGTIGWSTVATGTVTSVDMTVPTGLAVANNPITTSGTLAITYASGYAIPTTAKQSNWDDAYTFVGNFPSQTSNSGKYLTTNGSVLSWATLNTSNWDTAYTDRLKWDGGSTGLTASTGRTSLGATTVGSNLFTLTNPSSITFIRMNADNTVTARSASELKTDLSLNNVENTALSTWAGSTNITTLGTVSTGTISGGTY